MSTHLTAKIAVVLVVLALLWWGIHLLCLPPIYFIARPNAIYEGYALLALSLLFLVFFSSATARLMWLMQEAHRIVSTLLVMAALGMDGLMHAFSIPHMEGWWLPLLGSGACISFVAGWWQKLRHR